MAKDPETNEGTTTMRGGVEVKTLVAEKDRIRKVRNAFDKDEDGLITKDEIKQTLSESKLRLKDRFHLRDLDVNKDGKTDDADYKNILAKEPELVATFKKAVRDWSVEMAHSFKAPKATGKDTSDEKGR